MTFGYVLSGALWLGGLRLVLLGRCFHHVAELDVRRCAKTLVVLILYRHFDRNDTAFKDQCVCRYRIGREPVLAVDLFTVGFKLRILRSRIALLAHGTPVGLDDLQFLVIHPRSPGKVSLARLNALWLFPAIMVGIVFAKPFIARWVGDEFANASALPFYILLIGVFVNVIAYIPWAVMISSGKTGVLGRIYAVELFVYAAIAWVMISQFGIIGAAVAWSLRVALDGMLLFFLSNRYFGTRIGLIQRFGGLVLAACVLAVPLVFRFFFYGFSLIVVASVIIASGVYVFVAWKLLIGNAERDWLRDRSRDYLRPVSTK